MSQHIVGEPYVCFVLGKQHNFFLGNTLQSIDGFAMIPETHKPSFLYHTREKNITTNCKLPELHGIF